MEDINFYISHLKYSWYYLIKLPKLNLRDIAKVDEPMRMYFYAYYGYFNMLNKYNSAQLSIKINDNGDNLMLLAIYIERNNIKLIEYLESRGFDIHYKIKNNNNIYLCAIYKGNIKLIKYLENRGLNKYLEYKDIFNNINNSYEFAIMYEHLRIAKKLNKDENYNINYNYLKNRTNNKNRIFITRQIKLQVNRFKISYISGF